MQPVPDIFERCISPDNRMGDKLKVNTVSMACNIIAADAKAIAFPAMYAIPALLFRNLIRTDMIVFNPAIDTILRVDTKKIIFKNIIPDNSVPAVDDFNPCVIFNGRCA